MGRIRYLLACLAVFVAGSLPAVFASGSGAVLSDEEMQATFAKMREVLRDVDTVRLGFRQERHLSVFSDTLITSGVCAFARPDKLRWDMLAPGRTVMVYDGRRAGRFEWRDGKRVRSSGESDEMMAEVLGRMARWMRGDFDEASRVHDIEMRRGSDLTVRMRPKSEEMRELIRAIELHVDEKDWTVSRVTILEPGGDRTDIHFVSAAINEPLPERTFDVENPAETLPVPSGKPKP